MFDLYCWVIKKGEYYVNAKFGALFTGITTGFTGYTNEETMKKDLEMMGGLEEGYYYEQVNTNEIPKGERVYT